MQLDLVLARPPPILPMDLTDLSQALTDHNAEEQSSGCKQHYLEAEGSPGGTRDDGAVRTLD